MLLLYTLVTGVAAAYCLLAIWVAVGRGHWFARACVLLGALALLVPIRAYESLILFGMTSAILVAGWGLVRLRRTLRTASAAEAKPSASVFRFRLADILLSCAVAGAISWLVSVLIAQSVMFTWWRAAGTAALLAGMASLTVGVFRSRGWWWRLLLVAASVFVAVAIDALILDCWWHRGEMLAHFVGPPIKFASIAIRRLAIPYAMFAAFLLLISALALGASRQWRWPTLSMVFRGAALLVGIASVGFGGWLYWQMLYVPQWLPGSSDRPNALPRILALAEATQKPPRHADAIYEELFGLLGQPSFMAWPKGRPTKDVFFASEELAVTSHLVLGLQWRNIALREKGRYDEAADLCLALVRLAPMLDAEGNATHRREADSCRHQGHSQLARLRRVLSSAKAREAVQVILMVEESREPLEATFFRDRIWHNRFSWRDLLKDATLGLKGQPMRQWYAEADEYTAARETCFARLLALDILIREHRKEHGEWPASLQEVTLPDHPDLLTDPFSGQPFIYQPADQEFTLYSVGKNEIDEDGRYVSWLSSSSRKRADDLTIDMLMLP